MVTVDVRTVNSYFFCQLQGNGTSWKHAACFHLKICDTASRHADTFILNTTSLHLMIAMCNLCNLICVI